MPVHLNTRIGPDPNELTGDASSWQSRLSRRSFLALTAAACACRQEPSKPVPPAELTWAFISDTHIGEDLKASDRGSNMADNLRRVIDEVGQARPDHVLINGDVARKNGQNGDYAAFSKLISPLQNSGSPMHLVLGNHDDRERFCSAFHVACDSTCPEKSVSSMVVGGLRWLLLDSLAAGNGIQGSLGAAQLEWLTRQLDAKPAAATVVCVHHNPDIPLIGLTDAREFMQIVRPRRQVKLVMFGHTHEFRLWQADGLHFLNLPAVGYRFKPNSSLGWVLANMRMDGAKITVRTIDKRQGISGQVRELAWRSQA